MMVRRKNRADNFFAHSQYDPIACMTNLNLSNLSCGESAVFSLEKTDSVQFQYFFMKYLDVRKSMYFQDILRYLVISVNSVSIFEFNPE